MTIQSPERPTKVITIEEKEDEFEEQQQLMNETVQ
jgi:hypothetical protein